MILSLGKGVQGHGLLQRHSELGARNPEKKQAHLGPYRTCFPQSDVAQRVHGSGEFMELQEHREASLSLRATGGFQKEMMAPLEGGHPPAEGAV